MASDFFSHYNSDTNSVLDVPLALCLFDAIDEFTGLARELSLGEKTITRPVPVQYGTIYSESITFDIAMIKCDNTAFSNDEQRIINRWLTSPKLPQWTTFSIGGVETMYRGNFTDVRWKSGGQGLIGVVCTFQADSPYAWKQYDVSKSISGTQTFTVSCDSDELEEYIYPVITISTNSKSTIKITNNTDNGKFMQLSVLANLPVTMDCEHCIVKDSTNNGVFTFEDIGWTDVGNVYWLRLLPGNNSITVSGSCSINLSYKCPQKLLGGWLW